MFHGLVISLLVVISVVWSQNVNLLDSNEDILDPNEEFKNSPVTSAMAVSGKQAELPCNISSREARDSVVLVIWYRDHVPTPIYSYDLRGGVYRKPKVWSEPDILGSRAYFRFVGGTGYLFINNTSSSDQASYRCRVDYKKHTTTHFRVNLTIIEPINTIRIENDLGHEVLGVAGPFLVGDEPSFVCITLGGDPRPMLTWWKNGDLISDSSNQLSQSFQESNLISMGDRLYSPFDKVVRNNLKLRALRTDDLRATYTCRAENHQIAPIREASVEIDMNFGPKNVEIRGLSSEISAGQTQHAICDTSGSRPPATITWWLDNEILSSTSQVISSNGRISTSTLEIVLKPSDEGRKLTCRAENSLIPAATIETSIKLKILYAPVVILEAGSSLNLNNIKEGDDVYFDCKVTARPQVLQVTWKINDNHLRQNVTEGIRIVGNSLVLQQVNRHQSGNYSCRAKNAEGSSSSNPLYLSVKFSPICRVEQTDLYGVGRFEKTTVICRVDSNPPPTVFRWAYNNSGEFIDGSDSQYTIQNQHEVDQKKSLKYTPTNDLDIGTLLCWARNVVGLQRVPCIFSIFPAGKPDPVTSCKQFNHTEDSISIYCDPGYGGGMNQSFSVEVWDDGNLRATDANDIPLLEVIGLQPGTRYNMRVFAENSMGRSQPLFITAFTLTDVAERRTALGKQTPDDSFNSMLGIIIGCVISLIIIIIVAVGLAAYKRRGLPFAAMTSEHKPSECNRRIRTADRQTSLSSVNTGSAKVDASICDLISASEGSLKHRNPADQNYTDTSYRQIASAPTTCPKSNLIPGISEVTSSVASNFLSERLPNSPIAYSHPDYGSNFAQVGSATSRPTSQQCVSPFNSSFPCQRDADQFSGYCQRTNVLQNCNWLQTNPGECTKITTDNFNRQKTYVPNSAGAKDLSGDARGVKQQESSV